jgi:hypothetical protein
VHAAWVLSRLKEPCSLSPADEHSQSGPEYMKLQRNRLCQVPMGGCKVPLEGCKCLTVFPPFPSVQESFVHDQQTLCIGEPARILALCDVYNALS